MSKARPPKRPEPVAIGRFTLRALNDPPDAEGRWRWRLEWYVARKLKTAPLGRVPTADAENVAHARIAEGLGKQEPTVGQVSTVDELLRAYSKWSKGRADLSPATLRNYTTSIRHMQRTIGTFSVDPLHVHALETHKNLRLKEGAASSVVALEIRIFRMAWKYGREAKIIPAEDLPRLKLKVEAVRQANEPTPAQLRRVLKRMDGWARVGAILMWATGARIGEVAEVEWQAFEEERSEIRLNGKTGARIVPLEPPVVAVLRAWRAEHPKPPRPEDRILAAVTPLTLRSRLGGVYLRRACEAEGIGRFTAKDIRSAVVNALFDTGADAKTEASLLGHSDQVAMNYYRKVRNRNRAEAVKRAGLGHLDVGEVRELRVVGDDDTGES